MKDEAFNKGSQHTQNDQLLNRQLWFGHSLPDGGRQVSSTYCQTTCKEKKKKKKRRAVRNVEKREGREKSERKKHPSVDQ